MAKMWYDGVDIRGLKKGLRWVLSMSVIEITSTSKLKSMDTISERENHSGKKNRGQYKHAN